MAGKGFTVKKDWDNPREHEMPAEGAGAGRGAPGVGGGDSGYGAGAHGRGHGYGLSALHSPCQFVHGWTAAEEHDPEGGGGFDPRVSQQNQPGFSLGVTFDRRPSPMRSPAAGC